MKKYCIIIILNVFCSSLLFSGVNRLNSVDELSSFRCEIERLILKRTNELEHLYKKLDYCYYGKSQQARNVLGFKSSEDDKVSSNKILRIKNLHRTIEEEERKLKFFKEFSVDSIFGFDFGMTIVDIFARNDLVEFIHDYYNQIESMMNHEDVFLKGKLKNEFIGFKDIALYFRHGRLWAISTSKITNWVVESIENKSRDEITEICDKMKANEENEFNIINDYCVKEFGIGCYGHVSMNTYISFKSDWYRVRKKKIEHPKFLKKEIVFSCRNFKILRSINEDYELNNKLENKENHAR